ncbi:outer membrane protein [Primorskyibacter sp. 2E233]|uniref:outer membrane protein n=1 Tax=Primorskyibacter sp. 2E233 TaxID=3413431 RepID=UPI003BF44818
MKRMIALTTAGLMLSGAAYAGSMAEPVMTTPPPQPAPVPVQLGGDWTGPYVGLSFGRLDAEGGGVKDDGTVYGLYGGYDYDFGQLVVGGELEYQATDDFTLGGVAIDDVWRLKARAGYDAGPALIYATAGYAKANTSIGDAEGGVYGLGMEYKVTDRFSVGGEYLRHDFNDVGNTNVDVQADTISLRGTMRF